MPQPVIKVQSLSKQYRLGSIGTGTIRSDFQRFWAYATGKEDPTLKIGQDNSLNNTIDKTSKNDYVWALKDINFEVNQGDVLGIIGKNGAGKSTLLKLLSQVTTPTTGNIKIKGRVASLLEVGTGFHPDLTGKENIFLNGSILGMNKLEIKSKFDEIVEFSGIEKYIDTPVKRYSSGMYVRLAFAVAAHLDPEILIVDEVLAVGDTEFQKKALGKMQDISLEQGRTVLFVSHNLSMIQNLCNRGILLKNGQTAFIGKTDDTVNKYIFGIDNENVDNLLETKDRTGNGKLKINKIEIKDKFGSNVTNIQSGETLKLLLFYQKYDQENLKVIPSVQISGPLNEPIFLHHSRLNGTIFNVNSEFGLFEMSINNLPLIPSKYNITYNISYNGECYDSITNAITFDVIESNFYKNGEIPPRSHGYIMLATNWEINI